MQNHIPIRVSRLRGDQKIPFDAYVKVAGKFILFCREGDSFEGERLERLKSKKLQKMYVPEGQFDAYNTYINQNVIKAFDTSGGAPPIEIRTQIVHGSLQAACEDLIEDPSNQEAFHVALDWTKRTIKFLKAFPESLGFMLAIPNSDFSIAHHSVNVAAISYAIAEETKLHVKRHLLMPSMMMGCLLHDIEHAYNNIDFSIPLESLSQTEKDLHAKHATQGVGRLRDTGLYDATMLDVVAYHEERIDGSGPMGKKEEELEEIVLIPGTANEFDHYLLYKKLQPKEALKKMLIDQIGRISLETMKAMQDVLKKRGIV